MSLKLPSSICLALVLPVTAYGQDSGTDARNWEGEAQLGARITSGNNDKTDINGQVRIKHEVTDWRNTGEFRSNFSETDGVTTSEKYRATLESDYKFADRQYWFVRGSHEDDRFSGFEYQSSLTTGYGNRVWVKGDDSFLDLSLGGGYRFNRLEQPGPDGSKDADESIARAAGRYDYALSQNSLFRQTLSVEYGLDEDTTTSESETSIQADIVGSVSMKIAYLVQHLSDPPGNTEKTDTELSVSVLYGF